MTTLTPFLMLSGVCFCTKCWRPAKHEAENLEGDVDLIQGTKPIPAYVYCEGCEVSELLVEVNHESEE